ALLVIAEIRIVPSRNHPAFSVTNHGHIDGYISFRYSELFTSADVRGNPRAVYNVLARKTGNVRARSADVFAINRRDTLPLPGKRPGSDGTSGAAAEYHKIVLFRADIPGQPS